MPDLDISKAQALVQSALEEDLGAGDITSDSAIPEGLKASARLIVREEGIIAGLPLVSCVYEALDPQTSFAPAISDGAHATHGTSLGILTGSARAIFAGERTSLNFLQRLSGIATLTRRFVQEVSGTGTSILDTRKTTPGWRYLEKYAIRVGGGVNHRMGLYDQVLLKDNHIKALAASLGLKAAEAIAQAIGRAREATPTGTFIGVEVRNIDELRAALSQAPDLILLDNMPVDEVRRCVALARETGAQEKPLLEVSGGVSLENVRAFAEAGVDRISVGALTHSAPALDIALELE